MQTLVVNLYGGPGTGKSSTMASVFSALKWEGINCEMAHEYAKEKVWEESLAILNDQTYIFAKQNHKINRLISQVKVVITDSPLLLSLIYGSYEGAEFKNFVLYTYNKYNNLNVFLRRQKPYEEKGRVQTEEKAKLLDVKIKEMLDGNHIDYWECDAEPKSVDKIVDGVMNGLSAIEV